MSRVQAIEPLAPSGNTVLDYDRHHLALYAALLDDADSGRDWRQSAADILGIDPDADHAERCWRSHLDRARWIVGDGLGAAISAFGVRPDSMS